MIAISLSCACGKRWHITAEQAERDVRCPDCSALVPVPVPVPVAPPAELPAPAFRTPLRAATGCPVCLSPIAGGETVESCPQCAACYHADCWQENGGCAVYGCPEAPATEKRTVLEMPVSYWGQEDKACPSCQKTILAAAIRCRHCGAEFSSARPEGREEFARRPERDRERMRLKRWVVALFVLSLLPCTAPIGGIAGLAWYASRKQALARLPAVYPALCRLGIAVGLGLSALTGLMMALYGLVGGIEERSMTPSRLRRLRADEERVRALFGEHAYIRLIGAEGEPPEKYTFELRVVGLMPQGDDGCVASTLHRVEVFLPLDYPRRPPFCRMTTPVFHPNIDPQKICIGDHWTAGQSLAELVVRIAEMVCYQSYNVKSPLNAVAAAWAEINVARLPLQKVDLTAGL